MESLPYSVNETLTPRKKASLIRREAGAVLACRSGRYSHRMTLTLASILIMTVAIALYAAVACLAMAGYILFPDTPWVDTSCSCLLVGLYLTLLLPLFSGLWRLACLMTAPDGEVAQGLAVSVPRAALSELFYPFASLRAYGRSMAVAMETLGFLLVGIGAPILAGRLVWLSLTTSDLVPAVSVLIMVGIVLAGLGWAFLTLLVSGRRTGFGYVVFVHEELSLSDANRYFRGRRRPLLPVLCLRVGLVGWIALSVAGIGVPFVLHTLPLGLCCSAAYGRSL